MFTSLRDFSIPNISKALIKVHLRLGRYTLRRPETWFQDVWMCPNVTKDSDTGKTSRQFTLKN
jgi:hypothetical protein